MHKSSEDINISAEALLMQLPGYVGVRGLNNNFFFGNLMLAQLAGLNTPDKFTGFTDFDAPWCKLNESLKKHDIDAYNGLVYKQLDPVSSASGFKVLLVTKTPYHDKQGNTPAVIVCGMELTNKEITKMAYLLDTESPFARGKPLIISNNTYIFSKCEIKLTPRELECMFYILRGRSYKRIARILNISHRTVEEYVSTIKLKFECNTKDELIEKAYELDLTRFVPESLMNNKLLTSLES